MYLKVYMLKYNNNYKKKIERIEISHLHPMYKKVNILNYASINKMRNCLTYKNE